MTDKPEPKNLPKSSQPPSAAELLESAKRLKSQALYVGATRLIQESRHLRETAEHARKEAAKNPNRASRKKPRSGQEK